MDRTGDAAAGRAGALELGVFDGLGGSEICASSPPDDVRRRNTGRFGSSGAGGSLLASGVGWLVGCAGVGVGDGCWLELPLRCSTGRSLSLPEPGEDCVSSGAGTGVGCGFGAGVADGVGEVDVGWPESPPRCSTGRSSLGVEPEPEDVGSGAGVGVGCGVSPSRCRIGRSSAGFDWLDAGFGVVLACTWLADCHLPSAIQPSGVLLPLLMVT